LFFACRFFVEYLSLFLTSEDEIVEEENPNKSHQAFYWLNSQAAAFLSSEYIALIRSLSYSSPFWGRVMRDKVETGLIADLKTFLALAPITTTPDDDGARACDATSPAFSNYGLFGRAFAKLNVIGGFEEAVRVGGRVLLSRDRDEKRVGTVTCAVFGSTHVDILLETGERMSHVEAHSLLACPEIEVNPSLMSSLSTELFLLLLSVIDVDVCLNPSEARGRGANFGRLVSQLQSKALAVVLKLISSKNAEAVLTNSSCLATIHRLVALAKECKPQHESERMARANEKHARLHWDLASNPLSQLAHRSGGRSMAELLPFFPAHVRDLNSFPASTTTASLATTKGSDVLLPTRFLDVKDSQGQIFWGNDYRDVECVVIPAYSRDIKYESLVFGNVAVPLQADYYFEITVMGVTSDSVISIGLSPESGTF
jgi:hypothetical protein